MLWRRTTDDYVEVLKEVSVSLFTERLSVSARSTQISTKLHSTAGMKMIGG